MDAIEKIEIWRPVYMHLNKAKKLSKRVIQLIPIKIRREMYLKTVVKATEKYHKLMNAYAKKHKLD